MSFDRTTSGLERTVRTARLALEGRDHVLELEAWPELEEQRGGSPSEIPDEDLREAFLSAFRGVPPSDATSLGGETVGSLAKRVGAAMDRLYADDWNTILVVLHGGVNRALLAWAIGGRGAFFGHFEQSPACINIIDGDPERFIVRTVNFTAYDPAHLGPRHSTLEDLHRSLKERAARDGTTMSDLILAELRRLAHKPSGEQLLARIQRRTALSGAPASELSTPDADTRRRREPVAEPLLGSPPAIRSPGNCASSTASTSTRLTRSASKSSAHCDASSPRGDASPARAEEPVVDLVDLAIQRYGHYELIPRIWELRDNFSTSDAAYIALAEVIADDGAPLLTADARLARAADGVRVVLAA